MKDIISDMKVIFKKMRHDIEPTSNTKEMPIEKRYIPYQTFKKSAKHEGSDIFNPR